MRGIEVGQETLLVDLFTQVVINESDIRNAEINALEIRWVAIGAVTHVSLL